MTISITKTRTSKVGTGAQTVFDIADSGQGIYFADASEISAQLRSGDLITAQTQGVDYTVSGAGSSSGQVTFTSAPADGVAIDIWRLTPRTQTLDLPAGGAVVPESIESAFDKLTRIVQEIQDTAGGGSSGFDDDHPLTLEAGGSEWDGESKKISNVADGTRAQDVVTVSQLSAYTEAALGIPTTATASQAISDTNWLVMANASAATLTMASGVNWCIVSRSSQSAADVTVEPPSGFTIEGNADGVVINLVTGPVVFVVDPDDATNYITSMPSAQASNAGRTDYGVLTVAQIEGIASPVAGDTAYATDGRKTGEGSGAGSGVGCEYDGNDWISTQGGTLAA